VSVDREFVRETGDAVRQLTVELVDLEESADRETLDEAFRRTHALKGNLGMVGLEEARDLAHALEDVLDAFRAGDRAADRAAIDAALDAADEINRAVERAHRGDPAPDLDPLTDRLRSLADETDPDAAPPPAAGEGDETRVDGADTLDDAGSRADDDRAAPDDAGDDGADEMEEAGFIFEPAGESAEESGEAGAEEGDPGFDDEVQAALDDASEFDDLDALVEEVDDASEFDDLEGGGSFDDLLEEEPDAGIDEPHAEPGHGTIEDEDQGLDPVDDLGLGGPVDGPDADAGDRLSEIAGDAVDDPTDDGRDDPSDDVLADSTDDVLDDSSGDILDDSSGDILDDSTDDILDDSTADVLDDPTEDGLGDWSGDVADDGEELPGDVADDSSAGAVADPGDDASDEPAADVETEPTVADDAPGGAVEPTADAETGPDAPPSSPGGAFDEFQEIQQEVEQDDDLDQLQEDIEETEFGEFDDEDDMTIDELLMTELDDSSAEAEAATGDAGGAFDESSDAESAADDATGAAKPAADDGAAAEAPGDDPASEPASDPEPEPEPAVERVDEPPTVDERATADDGPGRVGADGAVPGPADDAAPHGDPVEQDPTTADVEPAIREVSDAEAHDSEAADPEATDVESTAAEAPNVQAAVRELPDEEPETEPDAEPQPEPEAAIVPVEAADEDAADSGFEPAIREVPEPPDQQVSEPAVREVADAESGATADDGYEPAITDVEPADAVAEPGTAADAPPEPADEGADPEPVAAAGEAALDPEVEALLSEVEVSESEAGADASFESDAAEPETGEGLSGFRRDEATDAFEARFGDLFAAEADVGGSDAPTVPTIADSDLDASAFRDDADGDRGLPPRQRTTARASLSVDPEVGDELLRQVRELAAASRRLAAAADRTNPQVRDALSALQSATDDVRQTALEVRLMPLSTVTDGFDRVVRDVARDAGVEVTFETRGTDVHLDRDVLDRIGDPLVHLVRNAVDHGVEPPEEREAAGKPREGTVELRARREGDAATIEVRDDGNGLDPEAIRETAIEERLVTEGEAAALSREETFDLLFEPGFSTTEEVTETSGRGVGMDAVERAVSELNGSVTVESEPGEGTTVRLSVPVTVAVAEVVFLAVGDEQYAVPTADVESVQYATETVVEDGEVQVPTADGEASYPLVRLGEALDAAEGSERVVVQVDPDVRGVALGADDVGEKREVVITPYEDVLGGTPGIGGATLLEDNTVVNVIDVETL
jgi:two-component system chemotaxis sensor kinase CheA